MDGNTPTSKYGGVAQLGEHLLCKQGVIGSIPFISTTPAVGNSGRERGGRKTLGARPEDSLQQGRAVWETTSQTKKWAYSSAG